MNLLRTDLQTALHDLHVALQESVDNYQDAADFVEDSDVSELFDSIADERESLRSEVEQAIRQADDLPAAPDSEKEAGEQLIHRLQSLFSRDQAAEIIAQRLESEGWMERVLTEGKAMNVGEPYETLSARCRDLIDSARRRLEEWLEQQD
ncbi:hypothetical protein [Marinimicrobium locisalis]|uniref:hypothetical protein n=1 Tax=Marinimicrobium locisalis TaxID=546022 RepID=UPI0032218CFA